MTPSLYRAEPSLAGGNGSPPSASTRAKKSRRQVGLLTASAAMLFLAACGGGDGGTGGEPQYAVKAAMGHWLNEAGSWALRGTGPGGQTYTVTIASAPLTPGSVPIVGGTAARSRQTYSAQVEGVTIEAGPTFYFEPASLTFFGSDNDTGTCSVVTSNTAMPTTATVGAGSAFYTDSDYDACAGGAKVVATTKSGWSVETDAGIVMLCWKLTAMDLAGTALATQSTCIEIAQDGTLGGKARLAVTASGIALLEARNF